MPTLADVVRRHGAAYCARHPGQVLPSHLRALWAIGACRTAELGGSLAVCDDCGTAHLLYHSCRHRACPRCGHDETTRWLERQRRALLPVPYFHLVFTLPAELRRLVRAHQRELLDVLFRAAFESLADLAADPRYLGAHIGALAVLHTWTRTLEWHPHVHLLVPGGGLAEDGRTWRTVCRPGRRDFLVPVHALGKLFRGRFLHLARRALPEVRFPDVPWGKHWVVYAKRSLQGAQDFLLQYLGRYVHRTALTDKRIVAADDQTVTFTYRDSKSGKRKAMTLPALEFLRRFLQHVPPRGFHRVRAYGLLHPAHRLTLGRLQLLLDAVPSSAAAPQATAPPSRRCPACGEGRLRLVSRLSRAQCLASPLPPLPAHPARPPP
jgi:hypothetical protein